MEAWPATSRKSDAVRFLRVSEDKISFLLFFLFMAISLG
jgi:hypothetical protein